MKKTCSILCAVAMTAALIPCTATANFSDFYYNSNPAVGRIQAETRGAVLESSGGLSEASYAVGNGSETYLVLSGAYDASNKPYVKYRVYADKAGTYAMYIDSSSIPESTSTGGNNFSPYTVTINDNEPLRISGLTMYHLSGATTITKMATYLPRNGVTDAAQYLIFVALEAGANDVTFTVTGDTAADAGNYRFELNYFSFKYQRDNTNGDIADSSYVYSGNAYAIAKDGGNGIYAYYNDNDNDKAYVDYTICAPCDGAYDLSFVSNKGVSWLSDIEVTINDNKTLCVNSASNDVISTVYNAEAALYTNTATVELNKGMNKIEFRAVSKRGTSGSNYYMRLGQIRIAAAKTTIEAEDGTMTYSEVLPASSGLSNDSYVHFAVSNANIDNGKKAELEYKVNVTKAGNYDMLINMAGYTEPGDNPNFRNLAPIKLQIDNEDAFRLNTEGTYYTESTSNSETLSATIKKIGNLGASGSQVLYSNRFNKYQLTSPLYLTEGTHTIKFISDSKGLHSSMQNGALDKFDLVYAGDANVYISGNDGLMAVGETNDLIPIVLDGSGKRLSNDNITYSFGSQISESVTANGKTVTANSVGKTRMIMYARATMGTAAEHAKSATCMIQVYDSAKPFIAESKSIAQDGTVTMNVFASGDKDAELIIGRYTSEDRFTDQASEALSMTNAPCAVIKTTFGFNTGADKVKAFIWDSVNSAVPYSDSIVIK